MQYQNFFTGFVFYKPLKEHVLSAGVPWLYTREEFDSIFLPRVAIVKDSYPPSVQDALSNYDLLMTVKQEPYPELADFELKIDAWLQPAEGAQKYPGVLYSTVNRIL